MKMVKWLGLALVACVVVACTTYKGTSGEYMTIGKASMRECEQMVFPEGEGEGKEAIGFNCKEYKSDHIGSEFGAVIEAAIDAITNHIPGLPLLNKWLNGK